MYFSFEVRSIVINNNRDALQTIYIVFSWLTLLNASFSTNAKTNIITKKGANTNIQDNQLYPALQIRSNTHVQNIT